MVTTEFSTTDRPQLNGIDTWKDFPPGRTVMELESASWNLLLFYTQLRGSSMFDASFPPPPSILRKVVSSMLSSRGHCGAWSYTST